MRHAGVVDQHGKVFAGAHIGDGFNAGIRAEIGDQRTNLDLGEFSDEFFKPLRTTAHDYEVVSLVAEPPGKCLSNAGGRPGDKRHARATFTVAVRRVDGIIHAGSFFAIVRSVSHGSQERMRRRPWPSPFGRGVEGPRGRLRRAPRLCAWGHSEGVYRECRCRAAARRGHDALSRPLAG
jgi:hypothetical protein